MSVPAEEIKIGNAAEEEEDNRTLSEIVRDISDGMDKLQLHVKKDKLLNNEELTETCYEVYADVLTMNDEFKIIKRELQKRFGVKERDVIAYQNGDDAADAKEAKTK